MTVTLKHNGLEAVVVSKVGYTLLYLEVVGPLVTLEAMWAALNLPVVRRTGYCYEVKLVKSAWPVPSEECIKVAEETRYLRILTTLPSGCGNMALIHPSLIRKGRGGNACLGIGDEMPSLFFDVLAENVPLPLKEEWAPALWEKGREKDLVVRLPSLGRHTGWGIRPIQKDWLRVITEILGKGR